MSLLAFVLTPTSVPPRNYPDLQRALAAWGVNIGPVAPENDIVIAESDIGTLNIMFMGLAIPGGEVESAARYSLSNFSKQGGDFPPHAGHIVVSALSDEAKNPSVELRTRFTHAVAAVLQWAQGSGVYWGNGHVAHEAKFFIDVAGTRGALPLPVWTGVSVAGDARTVQLLSTGLCQFGLPEMMITAPRTGSGGALAYLFDMAAYVVRRGQAIPENDTVGRSATEKLRVRYEPSPLTPGESIAVIDLPS